MRHYLTTADFLKLQLSSGSVFERDEVVVTDNPAQPIYTYNSSTKTWDTVVLGVANLTGGIINTVWTGTQAQYDALAVKDANTLYSVTA